MMNLSSEDTLRLNVMFAKNPRAIRIDESKMRVFALLDESEVKFTLSPQGRDDAYLKALRQFLSSRVLGSPGGYPVYLKRWTRMGQSRSQDSLRKLLLLGEPEALAAVVHTPDLMPELARYAWWAESSSEHARQMLESSAIAKTDLGKELAAFLLEFLAFETESRDVIDSVRLVLREGLISESAKADLWRKGERKNMYYVGFLLANPDKLPVAAQEHPAEREVQARLTKILPRHPLSHTLSRLLSAQGQAFLWTVAEVLHKPATQDVCILLFDAIRAYFSDLGFPAQHRDLEGLNAALTELRASDEHVGKLFAGLNDHGDKLEAMLVLAMASDTLLDEVFGMTDSGGSVMRKKIRHIHDPLMRCLQDLNPTVRPTVCSGGTGR